MRVLPLELLPGGRLVGYLPEGTGREGSDFFPAYPTVRKAFFLFFFFFILVWLLLEFFPRVAATELGALVRGSKMLTPRES